MHCQLSRVGLAGLLCLDISADAPYAPPRLSGMSGIAFLIALILMIFDLNMRSFLMRHMVPCVP